MLIHHGILENLEPLIVAVDLGQDSVGQHEHGIGMPKVHACHDGQCREAFLLSNDPKNGRIVLGKVVDRHATTRAAKEET